MRRIILPLAAAGLLALAGCGTDDGSPDVTDDDGAIGAPDDGDDGGRGDDGPLATETQAAIDDLSASEGVAAADIEVVTAEQVTWSDGSLGCPDEDSMYTQALVDGYRIVLRAGGEEVAYHGADGQPPFRCDDPQDATANGAVS